MKSESACIRWMGKKFKNLNSNDKCNKIVEALVASHISLDDLLLSARSSSHYTTIVTQLGIPQIPMYIRMIYSLIRNNSSLIRASLIEYKKNQRILTNVNRTMMVQQVLKSLNP